MRAGMLVVMTGCLLLTGCANDMLRLSTGAAQQLNRLKPRLPEPRPDVVELHYIFLEGELGDPKINDNIWKSEADEQCIPLDTKANLAENGLRIGKIGSRLSPSLLQLLQEQKDNQSGRRHHAVSGQLAKIEMTEVLPTWNLFQKVNGQTVGDQVEDAQGFIFAVPTINSETTVSLDIVPEIEYGPREQKRVPTPDLAGWQFRMERSARKFPNLASKIELASGEYVVVGTMPDQGASLGYKLFTHEMDGKTKQVILLIRVVRPNREELLTAGYDFDDFFLTPIARTQRKLTTPALETVMSSKRLELARVE